MIRKLLSPFILLLALSFALSAQEGTTKVTQEPTSLPQELGHCRIYGLSPNGRYIYGGSRSGDTFCYDTQEGKSLIFAGDPTGGGSSRRIYAVTDRGELFVSGDEGAAMICNMAKEQLHTLASPDEKWSNVLPVYVTADGNHLVGYLMDPSYEQESMTVPICGSRSDDGSWTMQLLPMLETDYMGFAPNYTQAFFCSPDGKKIIGRQNVFSGADRPIYWELDSEGQYKVSTPFDAFLYNLDAPLPGPMPQWEDYVTADPETEPDLYAQQEAEYNKAYDEWAEKRDAVSKNVFTDLTWQEMAAASGYWMIVIQEIVGEGDDWTSVSYPGALNVYTGEVERLNIPEAYGMGGLARTDDGGWVCYPDGTGESPDKGTHVIYPDGKKVPLLDYLKLLTGRDLSEFFTYSYIPSEGADPETITDMGTAHFSADGKTITSSAVNMEGSTYYRNAFLRIDKNPLAKPLAVAPVVLESSSLTMQWQGDALQLSEPTSGMLYIYDTTGRLLGSYSLTACSRLPLTDLTPGLYVGQLVTRSGVSTIRFAR